MRFRLTFAPPADQSFSALPRRVQRQFDRAFEILEQNPRQGVGQVDLHQLYGYRNVWRIRIGAYRGVYAIAGGEVVIVVFGHRSTIYSTLHHLIPPLSQIVTKGTLQRGR